MRRSLSLAMRKYFIEPRTRKYVKAYGFLSFARKYKKLLDKRLVSLRTASQEIVHKVAEYLGNKITEGVTKSNDDKIMKPDANPRNVEEKIIPLEKRDEILNKLRKVL